MKTQKFREEREASLFNLDWTGHNIIESFEETYPAEHTLGKPFILTKPKWRINLHNTLQAWSE